MGTLLLNNLGTLMHKSASDVLPVGFTKNGRGVQINPGDITSIFITKRFPLRMDEASGDAKFQRPARYTYGPGSGITVHLKDGSAYGIAQSLPRFLNDVAAAGRDLETVPVETVDFFYSEKAAKVIKGIGVRSANQFVRSFKL